MNELSVHIITQSKDLPIVEGNDLFHSRERFLLIEQTAGTWPYMVVVTDEEGRVKAHLLAELRRRGSLLPPYLFTFARVIGAGVYAPGVDKAALFDRIDGCLDTIPPSQALPLYRGERPGEKDVRLPFAAP